MSKVPKKITGVGSPIMDLLSHVTDEFVSEHAGVKGGMELVSHDSIEQMLSRLDDFPKLAAGGSAANTIFALAQLGSECGFVGKLGNDVQAKEYLRHFVKFGGNVGGFKYCDQDATARCLSLVTSDYNRTMRTCLGAAANLKPEEISKEDFEDFGVVHIEGYLLFNQDLIEKVLKCAKEAGCTVSLDLGSLEIVKAFRDQIAELLDKYVDIVFANEDEALAFAQTEEAKEALEILHNHCQIAVVKLGVKGALIKNHDGLTEIAAIPVETAIDTTGAGDYWAAGFLYGLVNDYPLHLCGQMGSILGAEVVQQLGAELPEDRWNMIKEEFSKLIF